MTKLFYAAAIAALLTACGSNPYTYHDSATAQQNNMQLNDSRPNSASEAPQ